MNIIKEKKSLDSNRLAEEPKNDSPHHGSMSILETFSLNQRMIKKYISRFIVCPTDIDDISQETFLRAYQAEKKKPINQPKAFLYRIAKNLALTELSKKSRRVTDYLEDYQSPDILSNDEVNLEDDIMVQQKIGIYCEAIATLAPQCRRAYLLRKVYGMSLKEIASDMGITVSTVETHLSRGLIQCKAIIKERYADTASSRAAALKKELSKEPWKQKSCKR